MNSRIRQFKFDHYRSLPPQAQKHLDMLWCEDLIEKADQALVQASYSYSHELALDRPVEYYESRMQRSVQDFLDTANHAHLVDVINWCRLIWKLDTRQKAYYQDTSGGEIKGTGR